MNNVTESTRGLRFTAFGVAAVAMTICGVLATNRGYNLRVLQQAVESAAQIESTRKSMEDGGMHFEPYTNNAGVQTWRLISIDQSDVATNKVSVKF